MATSRDLQHSEANYQALVEALAREGLPRRAEATRAVEAVMCALAQRTSHPDFDPLRELLPDPFRSGLAACERHAVAPRAEFSTPEEFYEIVAEDLDRSPEEVEPTVRAVFAAVRAQLPEKDAEDVASQLPRELEMLWRRPS
jgi:uncharacterized protein (DUF2267 family)